MSVSPVSYEFTGWEMKLAVGRSLVRSLDNFGIRWLFECLLLRIAFGNWGKEMVGQEEGVCDARGDHRAGNDGSDQEGVLGLGDDLMIEAEEGGDGAEGQACRHHQGVVDTRG